MREQSRWAAVVGREGPVRDALLHVLVAALFAVVIAILNGSACAWQFAAGYTVVQGVNALARVGRPAASTAHRTAAALSAPAR